MSHFRVDERAEFIRQLNDGVDYTAADRQQKQEEEALAEVCDHVHTRVYVSEVCECGMEISRVDVSRTRTWI